MNIHGINKAELLAALYNRAKPQGLGWITAEKDNMTKAEAKTFLSGDNYFDYLKGRVLKIDISGEYYQTFKPKSKKKRIVEKCKKKYGGMKLYTYLYNRDNGHNAAENVVKMLLR